MYSGRMPSKREKKSDRANENEREKEKKRKTRIQIKTYNVRESVSSTN